MLKNGENLSLRYSLVKMYLLLLKEGLSKFEGNLILIKENKPLKLIFNHFHNKVLYIT